MAGLFLSRLYVSTSFLLTGLVMAARDISAREKAQQNDEALPQVEAASPEEAATAADPGPTYSTEMRWAKLVWIQFLLLGIWRFAAREFISGI